MQHRDHATFIAAIHSRSKLEVEFLSQEDGYSRLKRVCAPFDYAPSRRAHDKTPRYHFWDYDSDQGSHTLSLPAGQVLSIAKLDDSFDPEDLITWDVRRSPWTVRRDWGRHS